MIVVGAVIVVKAAPVVIPAYDDGELPVDNVTINYGKIEWCYTRQNRAGGGAAGNSAAVHITVHPCRGNKPVMLPS